MRGVSPLRTPRLVGIALALTVMTVGCSSTDLGAIEDRPHLPSATDQAAPTTIPEAPPTSSMIAPEPGPFTFVSVVDGDTIETSVGTVRIIGIDTPERGACGHDEASAAIGRIISTGDPIALELPSGQNDADRYGRLLRYATTAAGVDLGLMQIESGNAIARYDSSDGYPKHPREADYHGAQIASADRNGNVVTTSCRSDATAPPPPADTWWMSYTSCTKLKKNTAGHPTGPFRLDDPAETEIYNWFAHGTGNQGDGDGDGLACE